MAKQKTKKDPYEGYKINEEDRRKLDYIDRQLKNPDREKDDLTLLAKTKKHLLSRCKVK